jgi:hypothetical protein
MTLIISFRSRAIMQIISRGKTPVREELHAVDSGLTPFEAVEACVSEVGG